MMKKMLTLIVALMTGVHVFAQTTKADSLPPFPLADRYRWLSMHEGLNVSLSASVIAGFGKNAPHGAGFAQSINATLLKPIDQKLSVAVGGYLSHLSWGGANVHYGGVYGMLSYQFDEHWEAHVYGQKSLTPRSAAVASPALWGLYGSIAPYSGWGAMGYGYGVDRIGVGARYNFSPSFSFEVNVEQVWLPNQPVVPVFTDFSKLGNSYGPPVRSN